MICPICKKGNLEEYDFDKEMGVCDNLDCGEVFEEIRK